MQDRLLGKFLNKKNQLLMLFLAILMPSLFFWLFGYYFLPKNPIVAVIIGESKFRLEKVESEEKKSLGLGGRNDLCDDCGMIFVFSEKSEHIFWMKGMKFPLDILWLNEGKIVHQEKDVPFDSEKRLGKGVISDMVIELNAGTIDAMGIESGREIEF